MKNIIKITSLAVAFVLIVTLFIIKMGDYSRKELLDDASNEKPFVISTQPAGIFGVYENQKVKVTAVALTGAEVTVRVGAKKYKAKEIEKYDSSYSVYSANVKMPSSQMEIESVGVVAVNTVLNSVSSGINAFQVFYSPKLQTVIPSATEKNSTTLTVQNYISEEETLSVTTAPPRTTSVSEYTPSVSQNQTGAVTGKLCVVTESYADTFLTGDNDTTFIPYLSPLAMGTMDYVVSESSAYDSEAGKTREFYTLSSGRKVLKSAVTLYDSGNMGDNTLSVLSSYGENGNLHITLSESWKVPYSVSIMPQQYYSSHGKNYNVKEFTAQTISFTFYHTVSAGGTVDTSSSDTVSSSDWSVDPYGKTATLTLYLRNQGEFYGYSVRYDENGNFIISIHNKPKSLAGTVILLDPGHGGTDSGALGYSGAIKESQLNFANAVELKYELERRGATVYLTRYDDVKVTLEERKAMSRALRPDLFISLHCDGNDNKGIYGTSAFYYKPMSEKLARSIYGQMINCYSSYIYRSNPARAAEAARGYRYHPFSVTRIEDCPSVLIETGYVTNDEECRILVEEETRKQIAVAIANGIENYIYS